MKTAIFASVVASAAAFSAPSVSSKTSTQLQAEDFTGEIGVTAPLGFFDPFNVLGTADKAEFDRIRAVELKHGRVSMLAVVGYLVTYAGVRFPGCEDVPSGFDAWGALPSEVWAQMFFTWGLMELVNRDVWGKSTFPGDFRNGALDFGWDKQTEEWQTKKRTIELNNGRAAQMGILGIMVHEKMGNLDSILP